MSTLEERLGRLLDSIQRPWPIGLLMEDAMCPFDMQREGHQAQMAWQMGLQAGLAFAALAPELAMWFRQQQREGMALVCDEDVSALDEQDRREVDHFIATINRLRELDAGSEALANLQDGDVLGPDTVLRFVGEPGAAREGQR